MTGNVVFKNYRFYLIRPGSQELLAFLLFYHYSMISDILLIGLIIYKSLPYTPIYYSFSRSFFVVTVINDTDRCYIPGNAYHI